MIKNGFLRFCDDPELACCRAERELGQLREKNVQLRSQLQDAERRERAAVEFIQHLDREYSHYISDRGFEQWRGPQEAGKGEAHD